jgi:hypothetical protein
VERPPVHLALTAYEIAWMQLVSPMPGDVAMGLLTIERLGQVAASDEERLVVAAANPHWKRGWGHAQRANLDSINARELDANSCGKVGADRGVEQVVLT